MMTVGKIDLTDEEQALVDATEWITPLTRSANRKPDVRDAYLNNQDHVVELYSSLVRRRGIPAVRAAYFTDPAVSTGRGRSSHKETFERNGSSGVAMVQHLHFLPYLWYFINGADLPNATKVAFAGAAREPYVDSRRLDDLAGKQYRELVYEGILDLNTGAAHEEFYKLALDCGVDWPSSIRSRVQSNQQRLRLNRSRRR